jgi:hypothetical protein
VDVGEMGCQLRQRGAQRVEERRHRLAVGGVVGGGRQGGGGGRTWRPDERGQRPRCQAAAAGLVDGGVAGHDELVAGGAVTVEEVGEDLRRGSHPRLVPADVDVGVDGVGRRRDVGDRGGHGRARSARWTAKASSEPQPWRADCTWSAVGQPASVEGRHSDCQVSWSTFVSRVPTRDRSAMTAKRSRPRGGSVDAGALAMYRVRDGKIAEIWYYSTLAQSIRTSATA